MTNSISVGLYDSLNIFSIGGLILFLITKKIPTNENIFFFVIGAFLIGLIYHQLLESTLGKILRNCRYIQERSYAKVSQMNGCEPMPHNTKRSYIEAYYIVAQNNCLMNITILEAHIAFIRNIWIILFFYMTAICSSCFSLKMTDYSISQCNISVGITFLIVALPFVWYKLQSKVSYLVWEGAYFISKIQKDEKNNSN